MKQDWPTQQHDMEAASLIVDKYLQINEGDPLGFIEVVLKQGQENKIELRMPDWILELYLYFRKQYGYEHGYAITSKVLTRFLLKDEMVH